MMHKSIILLFIIIITSVISACSNNDLIVLVPDSDGQVGEIIVSNQAGSQNVNQAYTAMVFSGQSNTLPIPEKMNKETINDIFSTAIAAVPDKSKNYILYFMTGGSELTPESKILFTEILQFISKLEVADIFIVGHTDTQGESESNEKLALERAQKVRAIIDQLGLKKVSDDRNFHINVTSYGEGDPLIPTDDNVDEPRNRRVEVVIH